MSTEVQERCSSGELLPGKVGTACHSRGEEAASQEHARRGIVAAARVGNVASSPNFRKDHQASSFQMRVKNRRSAASSPLSFSSTPAPRFPRGDRRAAARAGRDDFHSMRSKPFGRPRMLALRYDNRAEWRCSGERFPSSRLLPRIPDRESHCSCQ